RVGVERRLPQLLGVHLAEALVALQRDALAAGGGHRVEQIERPVDRRVLALATQVAGARVDLLQRGGELVELARVGGAERRLIAASLTPRTVRSNRKPWPSTNSPCQPRSVSSDNASMRRAM